uniref:Uncharacterized protein n=1 Tax=Megaselia scalaris TaxID=36166 RepID=T1GED5_MEGSC
MNLNHLPVLHSQSLNLCHFSQSNTNPQFPKNL